MSGVDAFTTRALITLAAELSLEERERFRERRLSRREQLQELAEYLDRQDPDPPADPPGRPGERPDAEVAALEAQHRLLGERRDG